MHQYATWYGGRPHPRGLCVRWTPSPPPQKGGGPPPKKRKFSAHVYCGQTAGWIKMSLGTKVGLGTVHIVLDGVPAPAKSALQPPPSFRLMSIVATVAHLSYC